MSGDHHRSITPSRKSQNNTTTTIKGAEISVAAKTKRKLKTLQNKKSNIRLARLEKVRMIANINVIDVLRPIRDGAQE